MKKIRCLPKLGPTGLFGIFILASFLACTLIGGIVLAYRTHQTTIEQQQLTSQHELTFAASFLELFLFETIDDIRSVARSPITINNVMDGGESKENLKDLIAHREDENLTLFDLNLDIIYSNSKRQDHSSLSEDLTEKFNAILDGQLDSHIFLNDFNGSIGINFAIPVIYAGSIEGVLLADLPAIANKIFPEFTNDYNTFELVGERHTFLASEVQDRDAWLWLDHPLEFTNLTLRLGHLTEPFRAKQQETVKSALLSVLATFVVSFAAVYWLGRRILLKPYHELEASRRLLADNAQRLKASEREARQLALVAENAKDMVVISDPEGNALWVNNAFRQLTGYGQKDVLGHNPLTLLQGPDTNQEAVQDILQSLAKQERGQAEVLNYTKSGRSYWAQIDIVPVFEEDGQLANFVAIERDVTERVALTDHLKSALAEAKHAAKSKTQFLAMMSHEIRTPMNGVLGTLGLLAETPMSNDQKVLVKTAMESGEFLLTILNDILDFSKLEAGKLQLENIPFNIPHLVKGAIELCQAQASAKNITIRIVLDPNVPDWVQGDPGRIRQMLLNYLSNAIKFTEKGGVTLKIEAHAVEGAQIGLRFSVRDTGIGIPEDKIDQLFNDFNQVDGSISRRFGGTGLGLAITKLLAGSMKGRVWLESESGEGSTFFFEAPFEVAKGQIDTPSSTYQGQVEELIQQGLRVLVAEDNRTNQLVIRTMLERLGCTVDIAANGIEAVEAASARPHDIILMDMQMPEMDGLAATRMIRANPEISDRLPIIALTANVLASDKENCVEAGMNSFVGKPINKTTLVAEMNAVLAAMGVEQAA